MSRRSECKPGAAPGPGVHEEEHMKNRSLQGLLALALWVAGAAPGQSPAATPLDY